MDTARRRRVHQKQIRRARREQAETEKARAKVNPATLFILSIALVVLVFAVAFFFLREDPGLPPWPGAIWSPLHEHWH